MIQVVSSPRGIWSPKNSCLTCFTIILHCIVFENMFQGWLGLEISFYRLTPWPSAKCLYYYISSHCLGQTDWIQGEGRGRPTHTYTNLTKRGTLIFPLSSCAMGSAPGTMLQHTIRRIYHILRALWPSHLIPTLQGLDDPASVETRQVSSAGGGKFRIFVHDCSA